MMRIWWVGLLVVGLLLGACDSPEDETVPEPETIEDCDGLVDVGAQLARAYVRVLEATRIDDLTSDDVPPEFLELERIGMDLDARVVRLDCDADDLNTRINDELGDVDTDSPAAAILLQIVETGLIHTPTVTATTTPDNSAGTTEGSATTTIP